MEESHRTKETFNVTPWEVSGPVDYDKLLHQFGVKRLDHILLSRVKKLSGERLHPMIRRNFVYAHRDLDLILNDYESGKGFFIYTGRGPSGPMHIGHLVPLLFNKWLQDTFDLNLHIQVTDDEKFVYKQDAKWEDIDHHTKQNLIDIAALGFNPDKTFIFRDSEYIKNTYPLLLKIAKKITLSTARATFGFQNETNLGLTFYPVYQIATTFFEEKRCLVPCAIDQDPYFRMQRDIAESLGFKKTATLYSKFLPSLTGTYGKMSSSLADTAIWLDDDEKKVKNKINKYAFSGGQATVEEHRRMGGNPEVDVSFQWLKILFEPSDPKLRVIEHDYHTGKLLTGELKQILIERVNSFLIAHREKRKRTEKELDRYMYSGKLAKQMWGKQF
ncbi:tryptophan--tRNA ligase [Candidatus Micrarchaeota archaeon]|nr:tryptophan--tRNA ligase [Candidatus Micrarchaeota archaeon]